MSTIHDFLKTVHEDYVRRIDTFEKMERKLPAQEGRAVSMHSTLVNIRPHGLALNRFLGLSVSKQSTPWALFFPPPHYEQRRIHLSFSQLAPSMEEYLTEVMEQKRKPFLQINGEEKKSEDEFANTGGSEDKKEVQQPQREKLSVSEIGKMTQSEGVQTLCWLNRQLQFVRARILQFLQC